MNDGVFLAQNGNIYNKLLEYEYVALKGQMQIKSDTSKYIKKFISQNKNKMVAQVLFTRWTILLKTNFFFKLDSCIEVLWSQLILKGVSYKRFESFTSKVLIELNIIASINNLL